MAVAINNPVTQDTSSGTSVSFSYTSSSGSDRVLLAQSRSNAGTVTACTYAGASLTALNTTGSLITWLRIAPATGSNTLAFTISSYGSVQASVANFTGADQTTPTGTAVTAAGTSTAPSSGSVTCPTNGIVWGGQTSDYTTSGAPTMGSGVTSGGSIRNASGGHTKSAGYRENTGPISFTLSSSSAWNVQAYPINPVAAAASSVFVLAFPRPILMF